MDTLSRFGLCKICCHLSELFSLNGQSRSATLLTLTLLFACLTTTTHGAPRTRRSTAPRWYEPCGGKSPADISMEDIWEIFGEEAFEEDAESLRQVYHDLARKATHVKEKIFELRDKMVIERIGSLTLVESLDQGGFSLKGMPEVKVISESHPGDDEAYGHIARLAVFLEQSRMDEDTHEPSSVSYVPHLREIEEDIYWILCSLQGAMHQQKQQVSQHVTHDVMAVELRDIPDRMMRRQRDYIILRDSAQVLYHTSNHFSRQATDLSAQSSTWLNRLR